MLHVKSWIAKVVNLYHSDGRNHVRIPADFQATITGEFGLLEVRGIDANRAGAGVQSSEPLPMDTLVFLRMTELGLMGFAHVRHCSRRGDGYLLGLKFRECLARERKDSGGWNYQQLALGKFRMWDDPEPS